MSINTGLYPLIYKCKLILGEASKGIQDQLYEIALTENRVYNYRSPMIPLDTVQISDSLYKDRPKWFTYTNHRVWQATSRNWGVGVTFLDFEGDTITPDSFESETGVAVLTTPARDLRITGYSYAIYRTCLYVLVNVMSDKASYYDYSTSGGSQNESQWFENLLRLVRMMRGMSEV